MSWKIAKEEVWMIFFYILIFIDFVGQINGSSIICLISIVGIIILSLGFKVENFLLYMMTCLPFFNILNYKMGTVSMFYVLIIIFIVKYFFKNKQKHYKMQNKILIISFLLIFSIYNVDALETYVKWVLKIIPVILIYKEEWLYKNINKIITYLTTSTILSSIMGYILMTNGTYIYDSSYVWTEGMITVRFSGLSGDSLVYSQFILMVMAFNLIKIEKFKCNKALCITSIAILCIFGFLTYSKTFVILLAICIFTYLIYKLIQYVKNKKSCKLIVFFLVLFISISATIYYIYQNVNSSLIYNYITRFSAQDLLTGRNDVYQRFIGLWKDNLMVMICGIGFSQYIEPFSVLSGEIIKYSHNIYIETISLFGVAISIALAFIIIIAILKFLKNKGDAIYLWPIGILAVSGLVLHGHLEFAYYFNILITLILFDIGKKEIMSKEEIRKTDNVT